MSLTSRLATPPRPATASRCQVGKLLTKLQADGPTDDPTSEYTALVGALASSAWTSAAIEQAVFDEGHGELNDRHVREHRKGRHTAETCLAPTNGVIK